MAASVLVLAGVAIWVATRPGAPTPRPSPTADAAVNRHQQALERLARAWQVRGDPAAAIALLQQALELDPELHQARVQLGVAQWTRGASGAARAAWAAVPAGTPERATADLYLGLESFGRLEIAASRPFLQAVPPDAGDVSRVARATLASEERRWDEARALLAGVSGWPAALVRAQCEWLGTGGDRAEAERCFDQALREGPPLAWVFNNRGGVREERGDREGALADFERAIAMAPDFAEPYYNRGLLYQRAGDYDAAWLEYRKCLDRKPAHGKAAVQVAFLAMRREHKLVEAERVLRACLANHPDDADALRILAECLHRQGRLDEARRSVEQAIAVAPTDAVAHNIRGLLLKALGRGDEALACFDQALTIDPDLLPALVNRGQHLANLGRWEESLANSDRILARIEDVHVRGLRGQALDALGRTAEAEADYQQAFAGGLTHPHAAMRLAQLAVARGDMAGALAYAETAHRRAPESFAAAYNLGLWCTQARRHAEAALAFGAAVKLEPGHMQARLRHAHALHAAEDVSGAVAAARAALDAGAAGGVEAQLRADLTRWEQELALAGGR